MAYSVAHAQCLHTIETWRKRVGSWSGGEALGASRYNLQRLWEQALSFGSASTEEKRTFVRNLGADAAIDYDASGWTDEVLKISDGRGVDIILESIGGEIFEQNFLCLAKFGRHIIFGSREGPESPLAPRQLMAKSQALIGIYLPIYFARPELIRKGLEDLVEKFVSGAVQPHVALRLPLSQVAEAHRLLEERKVSGMIVLDPQS